MHRRLAALTLAALAALILVAIFSPYLAPHEKSERIEALAPRSIAGYPLANLVSGEKAVEIVRGIHWEPNAINITRATIAFYARNGRPGFRLWVAVTANPCTLVDRMASSMRRHETMLPYTAPVTHTFNGVRVYLSLDKRDGHLHAFWCEKRYVIWLEVFDRSATAEALKQVISFYAERG